VAAVRADREPTVGGEVGLTVARAIASIYRDDGRP
jgi:hypothetical protein